MGGLFTFLIVFFIKSFNFDKTQFVVVACAFGVMFKSPVPNPRSRMLFSSTICIVLGLTFSAWICFELIFVYDVR